VTFHDNALCSHVSISATAFMSAAHEVLWVARWLSSCEPATFSAHKDAYYLTAIEKCLDDLMHVALVVPEELRELLRAAETHLR